MPATVWPISRWMGTPPQCWPSPFSLACVAPPCSSVILSGANISSTYLSTRQDRYIVTRSAPQLASLLRQVVDAVSRFSYQLHPLPPASQAADADGQTTAADGGSGAAPSGSLGSSSAGSRPRRRDVLLQLLQEQRLPWQQPAGQLDGAAARSWAQSLAALLGQQ